MMQVLEVIKLSIWDKQDIQCVLSQEDYDEMKRHALLSLAAPVLSRLIVQSDLREQWKKAVFQQLAYYTNYKFIQSRLPIEVPYVILKGTSASQYYPYPEYRTMGDIDIMTRREDYECACEMLRGNNWRETTSTADQKRGRHRSFEKNGFVVEVHAFFASVNDPEKARYIDDLIIDNITDNHILPDMINGIVLIDHVNQHMEEGIGLRQIIDWMMFVDKCLPDDKWQEFQKLISKTGMETLAITTTRMCEIFLGLSEHKWCSGADERLCHRLMNYIMESGNFGVKKDQEERLAVSRTGKLRHPKAMLNELQKKGIENWEAATRCSLLKPFAWIWQGVKYLKDTPRFKEGYYKSKELHGLFNALGVKRDENGLVYFENGEYIKKAKE